jgi:16S rRNA processing protein RimM
MDTPVRPVVIGELIGVHGVRGAFRMRSYCDPAERFFKYKHVFLRRGATLTPLVVLSRKISKNDFIIEIEGVTDRDATAPWIGAELVVDRSALPPAKPGEYYWADLEGLRVVNADGTDFGRVARLFNSGASDILVAHLQDPSNSTTRERLIPFVYGTYVTAVDLDGGVITVDWDPAL